MNKYEAYAVGHYLSSWPEDYDFTQIYMAMCEDSDDIRPTIPYEGIPLQNLTFLITGMVSSLMKHFREK